MKWSPQNSPGLQPSVTDGWKIRPESISDRLRGCNSGRARVLARRERLSGPRDMFPLMGNSVLGFGRDGSRGRDPSRAFHDGCAW